MEKPKCRFCGGRHWVKEGHIREDEKGSKVGELGPERMTNSNKKKGVAMTNGGKSPSVSQTNWVDSMINTKADMTNYKYRDSDKWREYMRGYMRERRVKK